MCICAVPAHVHDPYLWTFLHGHASVPTIVVWSFPNETFSCFDVCLPVSKCSLRFSFRSTFLRFFSSQCFFSLQMSVVNEQLAIIWIHMLAHAIRIVLLLKMSSVCFFFPSSFHWIRWNFALFLKEIKKNNQDTRHTFFFRFSLSLFRKSLQYVNVFATIWYAIKLKTNYMSNSVRFFVRNSSGVDWCIEWEKITKVILNKRSSSRHFNWYIIGRCNPLKNCLFQFEIFELLLLNISS